MLIAHSQSFHLLTVHVYTSQVYPWTTVALYEAECTTGKRCGSLISLSPLVILKKY